MRASRPSIPRTTEAKGHEHGGNVILTGDDGENRANHEYKKACGDDSEERALDNIGTALCETAVVARDNSAESEGGNSIG